MAKPKLMGMREYARHRGVRLSTVQAAVEAGRIPSVRVGGKPKVEVRKADREWDENTDPSKQNRKAAGVKSAAEGGEGGTAAAGGGTFAKARAVRETFQAKLTALKYETAAKEVVPIAKVKADWFRIARTLRDAFLNAPDRLSARAAAELGIPDADFKLNAIWRDEIRLILEELSNAEKRHGLDAGPEDPAGD